MGGGRNYGRRSKLNAADVGVRRVASTFGKVQLLTYSSKSIGSIAVESDTERLVAHMLTLDPRVSRFQAQPFTVDLIDGRLLKTPEAVTEARARHKFRQGPRFYTPDFAVDWLTLPRSALEVKLEGYVGDEIYASVLGRGADILESNGYRFTKVVMPANAKHPLRSNLPLLRKAASRPELWPDASLVERIETLCGERSVTLKDLCAALDLSPNLAPALLVCGTLSADLVRQRLEGAMALSAAYGDLGHLALLNEVSE